MFEVKEELTLENIFKRVSDYDLFKHYCSNFVEVGKHFNSELREDHKASAIITNYNGKLWYKDFGESYKAKDVISYISYKYGISFRETLNNINNEFKLGLKSDDDLKKLFNIRTGKIHKTIPYNLENKQSTIIKVNQRKWLQHDIDFWNQYKIPLSILKYYNIYPINKLWINEKEYPTDFYTYAFLLDVINGVEIFKIYSPYNKNFKWISNSTRDVYQGFNQLPWLGDKLIITKSLKDVAVLSCFKLPAIAPQSESFIIPTEFIEKVSKRFNKLYLLYDNDKAGIKGSNENSTKHNIPERFIPLDSGEKDISDYIKTYGSMATQELINKLFYD